VLPLQWRSTATNSFRQMFRRNSLLLTLLRRLRKS